MKKIVLINLLMLMLLPLIGQAPSQTRAYIFGTVYTTDGEKASGFIRWGGEELYWTDRLNATKRENPYLRYLDREALRSLEEENTGWLGGFLNEQLGTKSQFIHAFSCQFGDVISIKAMGGQSIEVRMRNGDLLHFQTGSNDLGASLQVYPVKEKEKSIPWADVDMVVFSQGPTGLEDPFEGILWGSVHTSRGIYTGQVQWDRDERCGTDLLDGNMGERKLSIPFRDIGTIARDGRGSLVILKDGNELFLTGSNDVNAANRGIIVTIPGSGRVSIPWEEFRKVHFETESALLYGYEDFQAPGLLSGRVENLDGEILEGNLAYDLDEAYSYEMLNGKDGFAEWEIPFRNIRRISPKNDQYSTIILNNGDTLLLGGMQDVSSKNHGVLVFDPEGNTVYLPYPKVRSISLE